jgi:hypothetical protein
MAYPVARNTYPAFIKENVKQEIMGNINKNIKRNNEIMKLWNFNEEMSPQRR